MSNSLEFGALTFATSSDYLRMAYALGLSLKYHGIPLTVGVEPSMLEAASSRYGHVLNVVSIVNPPTKCSYYYEAEAIELSPYKWTLKLDADVLFPSVWIPQIEMIRYYFETLRYSVLTGLPYTYRDTLVTPDLNVYRPNYRENHMPIIYSTMCVFDKSKTAYDYFELIRRSLDNWDLHQYRMLAGTRPQMGATDEAYSLAARDLDLHIPAMNSLSFVHLRSRLNFEDRAVSESWHEAVPAWITGRGAIVIDGVRQYRPVHYHSKTLVGAAEVRSLERMVGL